MRDIECDDSWSINVHSNDENEKEKYDYRNVNSYQIFERGESSHSCKNHLLLTCIESYYCFEIYDTLMSSLGHNFILK